MAPRKWCFLVYRALSQCFGQLLNDFDAGMWWLYVLWILLDMQNYCLLHNEGFSSNIISVSHVWLDGAGAWTVWPVHGLYWPSRTASESIFYTFVIRMSALYPWPLFAIWRGLWSEKVVSVIVINFSLRNACSHALGKVCSASAICWIMYLYVYSCQVHSGSWRTYTMTVCTMIHHCGHSSVGAQMGCVIHQRADQRLVNMEITTAMHHGRLSFQPSVQWKILNHSQTLFCGLGTCIWHIWCCYMQLSLRYIVLEWHLSLSDILFVLDMWLTDLWCCSWADC